jgi:hypothetical protein
MSYHAAEWKALGTRIVETMRANPRVTVFILGVVFGSATVLLLG